MSSPILNIKPDQSVESFYKTRECSENAGYDIYCPYDVLIEPGDVFALDFKIECEAKLKVCSNYCYVSYFLLPRSSISDTPLMLCNSIGLIDSGYRGNIIAKVRNIGNFSFKINKGTRLFQLVPMDGRGWSSVNIVDSLSESKRGELGFGSSGK